MIQLLETLKRAEEQVKIFGVGNVLDVAETNWDMFNIHFGFVLILTALPVLTLTEKLCVYNAVLPLSPFAELENFVELF